MFSCTHSHEVAGTARASSNTKTGARCMASATTVVFTPPHIFRIFIPRLWDATSVPSEVAMRDEELALGVLAVDQQRAGNADGHLGHSDEILAVALGDVGVEGILAHVMRAARRSAPQSWPGAAG